MAGSLTAGTSAAENTPARQQRILGLDTVRAFAALCVVLAHVLGPQLPAMMRELGLSPGIADLSKYIFAGHPAVIVFFVVSGFCIHYPYTRRALPLVAFTLARWTRIMPPALVAMALAHMLGVEKYNFVDGFILWSIVCELWYYSLYPLFLWLSRSVSFEMQFLVAFLLSLAVVSHLGTNQYGSAHIYGPGLNWLVALPGWLLGCVLAERLSSESAPKRRRVRSLILWRASVAAVASTTYWLTLNTPVGYYLTMNPFALLVFFWLRAEINTLRKGNSLFERTGKWSYSIYLFHMLFVAMAGRYFGSPIVSIPMTLCLCYLAYKFVEHPSHNAARRLFENSQVRFRRVTVAHRQAL